MDVTLSIAFFAGLISFFSPCVFPLMPAYLSQLTGTNVVGRAVMAPRAIILSRSLGFICGFTVIFLLLGFASTFIGQLVFGNRTLLAQVGGIIIILFGLQTSGLISIRALLSNKSIHVTPKRAGSFSQSLLLGFLFAASWTPCIGLALSSILALASNSQTAWQGAFLLLVYSFGMALPFLAVALMWSRSLHKMKRLHRYLPVIQRVSGYFMIVLGILLVSGHFSILSSYLARFNPFGSLFGI
ncbi:cytochrome c biogenesis CcdA family protein [Shouchella lonarensis]|uniref:Cytochrome c-type biogenesis protein n=1 Tax=Shouchella lonarensis TaxID=1464122 RepID=A0A1G6JUB5_9BACI|nr:cytochrome c biogenesis protein CcdA [Shouchella lonarensis]SDC22297.1 cytochrome c-type biogenesis protein [Shouchella lonarensis]